MVIVGLVSGNTYLVQVSASTSAGEGTRSENVTLELRLSVGMCCFFIQSLTMNPSIDTQWRLTLLLPAQQWAWSWRCFLSESQLLLHSSLYGSSSTLYIFNLAVMYIPEFSDQVVEEGEEEKQIGSEG